MTTQALGRCSDPSSMVLGALSKTPIDVPGEPAPVLASAHSDGIDRHLRLLPKQRGAMRIICAADVRSGRGFGLPTSITRTARHRRLSWGFKDASPSTSTSCVHSRTGLGFPGFGQRVPPLQLVPTLPFLTTSPASSACDLAGLLRPAADLEVHHVSGVCSAPSWRPTGRSTVVHLPDAGVDRPDLAARTGMERWSPSPKCAHPTKPSPLRQPFPASLRHRLDADARFTAGLSPLAVDPRTRLPSRVRR